VEPRLIPPEWPLAPQLLPLAAAAGERLGLSGRLADLVLVPDALAADDHAWLRLTGSGDARRLTLWFHPDQVLCDRLGRGAARPPALDWELGPPLSGLELPFPLDFSPPNAHRFLYQQLLLVRDILDGLLVPGTLPPSLAEAFQEAWLTTIDGRLERAGLPHLSAPERRLRFLHRFAPAGVLTPSHWGIFHDLWDGKLTDQAAVLAKVRLLPPLGRRRLG